MPSLPAARQKGAIRCGAAGGGLGGGEDGRWGGGRACSVQGRARLESVWAQDTRAKCTLSMERMSVTLDVSKLSGWLNSIARCRVERRALDVGWGVGREAGRSVGRRQCMQRAKGKARLESVWAQGTGGVHVEHGVHGRDARRVEAQRLVERLRFLPSRKGAYNVGRGRAGGGEGGGAAAAHAACKGRLDWSLGARHGSSAP